MDALYALAAASVIFAALLYAVGLAVGP